MLRYQAAMSPQAFEDAVLERLDRIESRMGDLERKFARWDGAAMLARIVLSVLGFGGIIWLVQMAAQGR